MLAGIISDLIGIFIRLRALAKPLARISLLWFALTSVGIGLTGSVSMMTSPDQLRDTALAGTLVYLFGFLAAWYTAHRFLLDPAQPAEYLPGQRQLRFIGTQVLAILALSTIASLLLVPVVISQMPPVGQYITQLEAQAAAEVAAKPYMPLVTLFMIGVFSRLLLMAPLIVRDQPQAVRQSWRLTKGHTLRLFLMQLGCLVPMLLLTGVAMLVSVIYPVAVMISTLGAFISLLAYTQLAETEYARLKR